MTSENKTKNYSVTEIKRLFDKTQKNIRRIQQYGDEFYFPVLNEWRYATECAVMALETPEKQREFIPRLKKKMRNAYYDSCRILADCCLSYLIYKMTRIEKASRAKRNLKDVLVCATTAGKKLQQLRIELEDVATPSEEQINQLMEAIDRLKPVFKEIEKVEDSVYWILRRRKIVWRISILLTLVEIVAVASFWLFRALWR